MKKIPTRVFNIIAVLSLIATAFALPLVIRSYLLADFIAYGYPELIPVKSGNSSVTMFVGGFLNVTDGVAQIGYCGPPSSTVSNSAPHAKGFSHHCFRPAQRASIIPRRGLFLGFDFYSWIARPVGVGTTAKMLGVCFPLWSVPAVCIAPALGRWISILRKRRKKDLRLCVNCGYDLRASSDRCPECGLLRPGRSRLATF